MKDLLAGACMIVAVASTLATVAYRLTGQPLNMPLLALGVAAWIAGAVVWRLDD